jgi:hypothetical protein
VADDEHSADSAPRDGPRQIAEFFYYTGFLDALRQRAAERRVAVSGVANDVACCPTAISLSS